LDRFGTDLRAMIAGYVAISLLSRGLLDAASRAALRSVEEARAAKHPLALCGALAWVAG
jgi:non-specific serine/threonine protein kinase